MTEDISAGASIAEDSFEKERIPLTVLGREVGTGTGWDRSDDTAFIQIYGFVPAPEYPKLPSGSCVAFDFETGRVQLYGDDNLVRYDVDMIEALVPASNAIVDPMTLTPIPSQTSQKQW